MPRDAAAADPRAFENEAMRRDEIAAADRRIAGTKAHLKALLGGLLARAHACVPVPGDPPPGPDASPRYHRAYRLMLARQNQPPPGTCPECAERE